MDWKQSQQGHVLYCTQHCMSWTETRKSRREGPSPPKAPVTNNCTNMRKYDSYVRLWYYYYAPFFHVETMSTLPWGSRQHCTTQKLWCYATKSHIGGPRCSIFFERCPSRPAPLRVVPSHMAFLFQNDRTRQHYVACGTIPSIDHASLSQWEMSGLNYHCIMGPFRKT